MMNGAAYWVARSASMVCRDVAARLEAFESAGPVLDIGRIEGLREAIVPRGLVTADDFTADILALPFADQTFAAVVGHWVLERLDGKAMPLILAELARVSRLVIVALATELLPGEALYSHQEPAGGYLNQFSSGWFLRAVATWPDPWGIHIERYRITPGGIVTIWRDPTPE